MPASTDPLDGLNKWLRPVDEELYLQTFNDHLARALQPPLDLSRPYLLQVARFDPSKVHARIINTLHTRIRSSTCTITSHARATTAASIFVASCSR